MNNSDSTVFGVKIRKGDPSGRNQMQVCREFWHKMAPYRQRIDQLSHFFHAMVFFAMKPFFIAKNTASNSALSAGDLTRGQAFVCVSILIHFTEQAGKYYKKQPGGLNAPGLMKCRLLRCSPLPLSRERERGFLRRKEKG